MAKIFGLNKPNTNLKKNVFDLSEKTLFSMSAGMLLPCMVRELNPGEKVKLNISSFTRTQVLNTAAFIRCRQYHHVFFVPFKQLWSGWDNFINGVDYKTSALQAGKDYSKVPTIPLFGYIRKMIEEGLLILRYAKGNAEGKIVVDEHGYEHFRGISRLLDMLGYGFQLNLSKVDSSEAKRYGFDKFPYKNVKSLSELFDLFTRKYFEVLDVPAPAYLEALSQYEELKKLQAKGTLKGEDAKRFFELRIKLGKGWAEYGYGRRFTNLYDVVDAARDAGESAKREIIEALNFVLAALEESVHVNPFRLLAYQKIYSDFYKRDDYEATRPENFNIDDFTGSDYASSISPERMLGMLRLRYRWLPKDYFTGIVPSELFGTTGAFDVDISNKLAGSSDAFFLTNDSVVLQEGNTNISTKSIRAAFAIEKMLRLTRRAGGQDYISQISAHYGFEPPKGRGDKVEFLGGYSTSIDVNEVINMANSEQASTGDIVGRGIGAMSDNKPIEFTAKEHGILMCITSIVPETDYEAVGMNAFNAKVHRGDYFHPEFQDLGLQPVFGYELRNVLENDRANGSVIGYVPRYSEYKTAYDTLHGPFKNGRGLHQWAAVSSFAHDEEGTGAIISSLKVNPKVLDSVFAYKYDGTENSDQFVVQAHFDIKAIRPMSITGQKL